MQAISRQDLEQMNQQHEDFVLVNVLKPEAFNQSHIPTSINVPIANDDFIAQVESVAGSKDRNVVVYCASFDCDASPKAAQTLEKAGFSHVYDYEGGMKDWMEAKHGVMS